MVGQGKRGTWSASADRSASPARTPPPPARIPGHPPRLSPQASGRVGVCIATSGPGATNLVTGLADAMLDSVPVVAITGQVPRALIGSDAFQETPIVEITRTITKHNFLIMSAEEIPRVMEEAFVLASTGRPGPVLVDIPKDVQQTMMVPKWDQPLRLNTYMSRLPAPPAQEGLEQFLRAVQTARKPALYVGGGCNHCPDELKEFVELTNIPVSQTLMGLGAFPETDERALQMLGMHGTVAANFAVHECDLLIALGVRFDDRVTGKLEAFAPGASIVHVDIDPAEIGKNKTPFVSINADVMETLKAMNAMIKERNVSLAIDEWRDTVKQQQNEFPMRYSLPPNDLIPPQAAIEKLFEVTKGEAIVSTGVGQHQMFAAQWYKFDQPRSWITSGGLGSMGFGLPSAIGAAAACPDRLVVDIDGDGSFVMNIQELATLFAEKIPVKMMILNNQHLGMVVQWEDRFYKKNRGHTYIGDPDKSHTTVFEEADIYPDFVKCAESFNVPAARVSRMADLEDAIRAMCDTPGPYLLDVVVPHQEHVLPMIPGGGSFTEIITTGGGWEDLESMDSRGL